MLNGGNAGHPSARIFAALAGTLPKMASGTSTTSAMGRMPEQFTSSVRGQGAARCCNCGRDGTGANRRATACQPTRSYSLQLPRPARRGWGLCSHVRGNRLGKFHSTPCSWNRQKERVQPGYCAKHSPSRGLPGTNSELPTIPLTIRSLERIGDVDSPTYRHICFSKPYTSTGWCTLTVEGSRRLGVLQAADLCKRECSPCFRA